MINKRRYWIVASPILYHVKKTNVIFTNVVEIELNNLHQFSATNILPNKPIHAILYTPKLFGTRNRLMVCTCNLFLLILSSGGSSKSGCMKVS